MLKSSPGESSTLSFSLFLLIVHIASNLITNITPIKLEVLNITLENFDNTILLFLQFVVFFHQDKTLIAICFSRLVLRSKQLETETLDRNRMTE